MRVETVGHRVAIPIANDTVGTKLVSIFDRRHDVITSSSSPGLGDWREPYGFLICRHRPVVGFLGIRLNLGVRSSNLFGRASNNKHLGGIDLSQNLVGITPG